MPDSVEDRVVRMEFDNSQFERKTAATIASLERLNRTLQLEGARRGFDQVQSAANGVKLNKISEDVDHISSRFSALSAIATGALLTIGATAVRAGARVVQSFTLGPIIDGFKEYETNIGSIQTILANTQSSGGNLKSVNAALQELNTYSDKTIYNFSEMARNIGTFTSAGVDLKTSTQSIKGIANLAAISGSNSEQASTAMYQLSQAIASGSVKLMDWNSVVNAGMGGKVFQEALFNTAKTMGTIKDVPMGETFKEWTDAGNSFRTSLQDGWLTSKVLTTTLQGFTGEMTMAQLKAKGYTDEQARQIIKLGKLGVDSATKVRTLTQLLSTVKEAIGSGWSNTFQLLLGNFTEATDLFTNLSNSIGGFVSRNAKYRNDLLKGWTMLGGRFLAFAGIKNVLKSIGDIFHSIGGAFRDIFPKTSVQGLLDLTKSFYKFSQALKPSQATIDNVRRIFRGLFAVLDIGWTVIKTGIIFIGGLVKSLTGLGQGNYLSFFAKLADFLTDLHNRLVVNKGIENFFNNLGNIIRKPLPYLISFKNVVLDVFHTLTSFFGGGTEKVVDSGLGRISDRFAGLAHILKNLQGVLDPILGFKDKIFNLLKKISEPIRNWFHELGESIAKSMHKGDFSKVLDGLNTALLGGIALLISRFLKKGFSITKTMNFDIGKGLFSKIGSSFEALTGTLTTMQTEIKANALLKIASAIGILTASVVVLSLIDSGALTKALSAMAAGFAELMASFAILNKMNISARDTVKFNLIAAAMTILAGAMVVLAVAVKIFASMKTDELMRGLAGITVGLTVLSGAAILISKNSDSFILASVGIVAISGALILLSTAMKIFATMSWSEMGKGLAGVAASLVAIGLAMQTMPLSLPLTAAGLVLVGIALNLIAGAMKIFATMSWKDMGKGLAGVAGSLTAIGLAMNLMPLDLPITAAGLILVGVALNIIAGAMKIFGTMKWDEIGRGLTVLAATLLLLVVATNAMSGAILGAASIGIAAVSLAALAVVLKMFAAIKTGDLVHALIGIAAALTVIGLAAYILLSTGATVAILALGAALVVLGASFLLIGAGVYLLGKGLAIIGEGGRDAAKAIGEMLESIGKNMVAFGKGVAEGVLSFVKSLGEGIPVIIRLLEGILRQLIATAIRLLPQMQTFISNLIGSILTIIREKGPDLINTGLFILVTLLQGIEQNIGQITGSVASIILGFLTALSGKIQDIVSAGGNLLVQFLYGLALQMPQVVPAVTHLIATFLNNLAGHIGEIIVAGGNLIISLLNGLASQIPGIAESVAHLIVTFLDAIANNIGQIITSGVNLIISFMNGIAQAAPQLANAAGSALTTFLNGMADAIRTQAPQIRAAGKNIADAIVDGITGGLSDKIQHNKVASAAVGLVSPAVSAVLGALHAGSPSRVFIDIGHGIGDGLAIGINNRRDKVGTSAVGLAEHATASFKDSLTKITDGLGEVIDANPTIKPVLDLSQVRSEADKIAGFIGTHGIDTSLSLGNAKAISGIVNGSAESPIATSTGPSEISFTQINNSPKALSERDIYKSTRNQLAVAKEKLHIP